MTQTPTPTDHSAAQRRIARNTATLYLRTIITMIISLYTSRIILEALGIDNFGINSVVGGVVGMFSIISGSMSNAISRFLSYHLPSGSTTKLQKIFSTSVNIQIVFGIAILIIGEIAGIWVINHRLNIPPDRIIAAHWVLHCSLLAFITALLGVPYNASIIAHEKMGAFAIITLLEVCLKLALAFTLFISPFDKLITFAICNLIVAVTIRIIYGIYCSRHFPECHYRPSLYDTSLLREMTLFAWWGFFGNAAWILNTQGISIIINIFFGVALNAARGIASQVEGVMVTFVNNFTTALNPQITKSYAAGDLTYTHTLICNGTKYAFFLTILFLIPIEFEAPTILNIWLVDVPPYAPLLLRLSIISALVTLYGSPSYIAIMATGNIRRYQIIITTIGCLVFPLTWIAYRLGLPVESTYYIFISIYLILIYIRLRFVRRLIQLPVSRFIRDALKPSLLVGTLALIAPTAITILFEPSFLRLIATLAASTIFTLIIIWFCGMGRNEQQLIIGKLQSMKTIHHATEKSH